MEFVDRIPVVFPDTLSQNASCTSLKDVWWHALLKDLVLMHCLPHSLPLKATYRVPFPHKVVT